jgi:hypothetical protein
MPTDSDSKTIKAGQVDQRYWIAYIGLFLAGLILLADAYNMTQLDRWTARVGIALVYTAFALVIAKGRTSGTIGSVVVWVAVLLTLFL